MWLALLALAPGCAPEPACATCGDPPADPWADWEPYEQPAVEPIYDVDDVRAVIGGFMDDPLRPNDIFTTWLELMSHGDELCPGHPTALEEILAGCTSSEGYWYQGIGGYMAARHDTPEGTLDLWTLLACDFVIDEPDGDRMRGAGDLVVEGRAGSWRMELAGAYAFAGHEGWLADGVSGGFEADVDGSGAVRLHGGVAVGDGVLWFDDVVWESSCDFAPSGSIRVRDPRGYWYTWAIDGCGPCGTVRFFDEEVGELCLDLRPLGEAYVEMSADRLEIP